MAAATPSEHGLFQFPADVLERIRAIIGARETDLALFGLSFAAHIYASGQQSTLSLRKAKEQLPKIEALLNRVQKLGVNLSADTISTLERTFDWTSASARDPFVTGRQALQAAIGECNRALHLVKLARGKHLNSPSILLAHGVAGALAYAKQPLSKGPDGLFARVLVEVWSAVEPAGSPEDVFPYIRKAVDSARRQDPNLTPPQRGRPRSRK